LASNIRNVPHKKTDLFVSRSILPSLWTAGIFAFIMDRRHLCLHYGPQASLPALWTAGILPALWTAGILPALWTAGILPALWTAGILPALWSAASSPRRWRQNIRRSLEGFAP
jgi:hypothetical protein